MSAGGTGWFVPLIETFGAKIMTTACFLHGDVFVETNSTDADGIRGFAFSLTLLSPM